MGTARGDPARTFLSVFQEEGLPTACREVHRYVRGHVEPVSGLYWRWAPVYYRHRVANEVARWERDIDIFARHPVDPNAITRFTGRTYDPPRHRWRRFGAVLDGDWDRRRRRPLPPGASGPPSYPELFFGETFEDTLLYRSFADHFDGGRPWGETAFVRRARRIVAAGGTVWQGCATDADLRRRCARVDELYASIRQRGVRSMVTMAQAGDVLASFPHALANEIVVDVARDGELLFANGRHRLAIAKLLDLESVPVAVLVRHRRALEGAGRATPTYPNLPAT